MQKALSETWVLFPSAIQMIVFDL